MNKNVVIFPHNKRAYEKVCTAFKTSNHTCVIQPTGTGKMYIAMQLMDAHPHEETLYLTSYSPILSALDAELKKCGVPSGHLSTALYAGLDEASCSKHYDYIIMDEFHRAGATVWGTWVTKLLANNPSAKVMGLSATPIRYLDNNRDMSDELFDGNVASSMTLAEAVGSGILRMPKYVCAVYSLAEELERYKERVGKMKADANKTEALALLEKARRSLEQAGGLPEVFANHMTAKNGRYIVFCRNYEHMESMEAECREWFKDVNSEITMYELRATCSDSINEQTLSDFNSDHSSRLKLLFVVDMLNEGVHLKNVDGCIMLRPTESMNVFLQQLGRAISVGTEGRTTIFDIVNNSAQLNAFGDFKGDAERASIESGSGIELDDFEIHEKLRDFWDIVSQIDILLANKSWDEWYSLASQYYSNHGNLLVPKSFVDSQGNNLGTWIRSQRHRADALSDGRKEKLDAIGMVWKRYDSAWSSMYVAALNYYETYGNLNMPQLFVDSSGNNLGQWISNQRTHYREGTLSLDRQKKLEAIGIVWNTRKTKWHQMYALATNYYKEYGNLLVPDSFITSSGDNLGGWIRNQRANYKRGTLPVERQELLEAIGMVWDVLKYEWRYMYDLAANYFSKHGSLTPRSDYETPSGDKLGLWLAVQRQRYKDNMIPPEQQELLESIGMVWNAIEGEWLRMFSVMKSYLSEHGGLNIPATYVTSQGDNLGSWVVYQRQSYREGSISAEHRDKLEALGFIWSPLDDSWNQMYNAAENYFKEHGDLYVPDNLVDSRGRNLRNWLVLQRQKYKDGKLSAIQIEKLEIIGMAWNIHTAKWNQMYKAAADFYAEHGHLIVPKSHQTSLGDNLGQWIRTQRKSYKDGNLSSERISKLEAIGMVWAAIK